MSLTTEADLQCRNLIEKHVGEVRLVATRLCESLEPAERQAILDVAGDEAKCREAVETNLRAAELRRLERLQAEHNEAVKKQGGTTGDAKPATPAAPADPATPNQAAPAEDSVPADDDTDLADEGEIDIATGDAGDK